APPGRASENPPAKETARALRAPAGWPGWFPHADLSLASTPRATLVCPACPELRGELRKACPRPPAPRCIPCASDSPTADALRCPSVSLLLHTPTRDKTRL